MSEHSLKELKRQYDAADSRAYKAQKELVAAEKRYYEALTAELNAEYAAKGIEPGDKVRLNKELTAFFGGVETTVYGHTKPIFFEVKKDGTQSKRKAQVWKLGEVTLVEKVIE